MGATVSESDSAFGRARSPERSSPIGKAGAHEWRATPSFFLVYLAVGLLVAEALIGLVLVTGGADMLRSGTSSTSPVGTRSRTARP